MHSMINASGNHVMSDTIACTSCCILHLSKWEYFSILRKHLWGQLFVCSIQRSKTFLLLTEFNFVISQMLFLFRFILIWYFFFFRYLQLEFSDTGKYLEDNAMCHIFQILASICILRVINGKYSYVKLCCKSARYIHNASGRKEARGTEKKECISF